MTLLRFTGSLCLLSLGLLAPQTAFAQFGRNYFNNPCCNVCRQQVCTCATTRPVIETRLKPQQCVTYQDRKRIACRTEPVCETVPVTKVDCVTVDEGCYQMIWVPKPVTKAIPRTEYHQRTSFRTVPFEVCEKVPVVTTHMVPEQTIRYVTEHHTVTSTAPVPLCTPQPACPPAGPACGPYGIPSVVPGFGAPGFGGPGYGRPGFGLPGVPGLNAPLGTPAGFGNGPVAVPYSAMRESTTGVTTASVETSESVPTGLVPNASYAEPATAYRPMTSVPVSAQSSGVRSSPAGYSRPVAAGFRSPSAAAVWQSPRRTP